jgi:hypothetical protein
MEKMLKNIVFSICFMVGSSFFMGNKILLKKNFAFTAVKSDGGRGSSIETDLLNVLNNPPSDINNIISFKKLNIFGTGANADKMLVRDCYRELANLYFHKIGSQWKNSILTGSPGTGKSLSVLYFLTEAVKIPSIEVIVLEFRKFGKLAFERHKHGWKPFKAALNPLFMPNNYIGLYITDPGIRRELAEHHEGFHNLLIHSPPISKK